MTAAVPQRSARARQRKPSNGRGIGGRSARHTRQSSSRRSSARGRSGIKLRALHLGVEVTAAELLAGGWDDVLIATGVRPRTPEIPGIEHEKVISYPDALLGIRSIGDRVAVIGAGGIGVDVSEFLTHDSSPALDLAKLCGR